MTASEMRISDWSSDVCSSALGRVRESLELRGHGRLLLGVAVAGVQHGDAAGEIDVFLAGAVPQRGVFRAHGIQVAHHAHAARRGQRAAGIQVAVLHFSLDGKQGAPRGGGKRRGRLWRGLRSDEHKSELQPLMRLSYAVFCLKKKKNTKHQ